MVWKQPAVDTKTLSLKACALCAKPAMYEYTETGQREPDYMSVWKPVCFDCHNNP